MSSLWKDRRRCPLCGRWATFVPDIVGNGGPVIVQVMCESCAPFDIAEELCADIELLGVDQEVLAFVTGASRRVNRAGGRLKIESMQEMLMCADDEQRLRENSAWDGPPQMSSRT
jgi:hypothetical protein